MNGNLYTSYLDTPLGRLQIFADDRALRSIVFPTSEATLVHASPAPQGHRVLDATRIQLGEYFEGGRQCFDLPLAPQGTDFQRAVWDLMQGIPFGATKTYAELAALLGNRNKARAVGGAANKNPLPLVVPCHRVVGSDGSLTGFAGGLATKKFLLTLEQESVAAAVRNSTVSPGV